MSSSSARRLLALGATLALGALAPGAASGAEPYGADRPRPEVRWVIGTEDARAAALAVRALRARGAEAERLPRIDALVLRGEDAPDLLATLAADEDVFVERARPRRPLADPGDAIDPSTGRAYTWAFDTVRAGAGLAAAGGGAPHAPVAIVDTGVDRDHPDLQGRVWAGHDVSGADSVADHVGHGTFVAALVSAVDGNGAGGKGVAGDTPILPVRVSRGTSIDSADLAAGIVWAVDSGARVINISLGGPGLTAVERAAIDYARDRDVVLVASAGNSAGEGNPVIYPAAAIGGESGGWGAGLSVAATDASDRPAAFSTHNRFVTIAAPGAGTSACGDGVYSAIPSGAATLWDTGCDVPITAHGAGRYAYGQGTSFSAPMVAGAAALVREVGPRLRADQVADVLRRTARPAVVAGWSPSTGAGVLDVGAAVDLGRRYDVTPPEITVTTQARAGGVEVRAVGVDGSETGRELRDGVSVTLEQSRDGRDFSALPTAPAGPAATAVAGGAVTAVRARACDLNRNCTERVIAVESTSSSSSTSAAAPEPSARGARTVVRVLAFAPTRHCARSRSCLRVVWRAGGPGTAVRFRAAVSEQGRAGVVARAAGRAATHRRLVLELAPRRPLRCGRVVLRLTVDGAVASTVVRRAAVRGACRAPVPRRR